MKIGILGIGHIGGPLARAFALAGHEVVVANSRGPETVPPEVLSSGARAVWASSVSDGVDVLVLSVPLGQLPDVAPVVASAPPAAVVIDTSNYYPGRDGEVPEIANGMTESLWVVEQVGRPVVKAWNAIGSASLAAKGRPAGAEDRIAIPVAADDPIQRRTGMDLVEASGFDAVDAGPLAESWRQQPGTPGYCTDLTAAELHEALSVADASRSARRRDLAVAVIVEKVGDQTTNPDADFGLRLSRLIYM